MPPDLDLISLLVRRQNLPFKLVALAAANDVLGIREIGDNRGPSVEVMQRAAKIPPGSAWCAALANWGAEYASAVKNLPSPLEDVPLQGYVQSYYEWGVQNDLIVPWGQTEPGDLFLVWHPSKDRYAHLGFVDAVFLDAGQFRTIEGNSNSSGSREGIEVAQNTRHVSSGRYVFLDWARNAGG